MTGKTKPAGGDDLNQHLRDLWSRRTTLSAAEWETLYTIVYRVLKPKYRSLVAELAMTPDEAIADFFADKVFALADNATEVYYSGALGVFYMRYLISLQRDPYVQLRVPPDPDAEDFAAELTGLPWNTFNQAVTSEPSASTVPSQRLRDDVAQLLGIALEDITREARDFLNGQGHWSALADESHWIRLYLRCHQCPDQEDAIPVSTLARRHQIPSYHDRAVKIGVTVPKRQDAALEAFRASYRGQWLNHLGIPVDPEHVEEMSLALKMLCLVALNSQEHC